MPPFYQTYLQGQLSRAEYLLLVCLVNLLQNLKQVRLETLATQLPLPIVFESRRRKLQRFLSLPQLNFRCVWFPVFLAWVERQFCRQQHLSLAMDRTSWARVNLLVVSLVYNKRAIPVYVRLLDKLGSSNFDEQKKHFYQYSTCSRAIG